MISPMRARGCGSTACALNAASVSITLMVIPPCGVWVKLAGQPRIFLRNGVKENHPAIVMEYPAFRLGSSIVLFAVIGLIFGPPGGLIMSLLGEAVRAE